MANQRISDLTEAATLTGQEVVPIVQNSTTVKATTQAIANLRVVPVTSVAGRTGAVTLTKSDVGLANVENTSDANKIISNATQTALASKFPVTGGTVSGGLVVTGPFTANGATQLAAWQSSLGGTVNGSLSVTGTATLGAVSSVGNVTTPFLSASAAYVSTDLTVASNLYTLGKLGIGTSTPSNTLEVNKNQDAQTSIQITNGNTGAGASATLSIQSTSVSKNLDITVTNTSCALTAGSGFSEFSLNVPSIKTYIGGVNALEVTAQKNIHGIAGSQAMTSGFFYIPKASGEPSGTPTAITGCAPMYFDSTANRFYIHNGTAWKSVLLA